MAHRGDVMSVTGTVTVYDGMVEEEAEPGVPFRSIQNILTDLGEGQMSPPSCDTSRELSL